MGKPVRGQIEANKHTMKPVNVYEVSEADIQKLTDTSNHDLLLSFFSMAFSTAVTLWITLSTCILLDKEESFIKALAYMMSGAAIILFIFWIKQYRSHKKVKDKILGKDEEKKKR